jgi:hypothetical protein
MPDRFGGESLIIPMEDLCKYDKNLYGTVVIYLYIENKLNRIQLYRPNMQDNKVNGLCNEQVWFLQSSRGFTKK